MPAILSYLLDRASEPSSYAGLAIILASIGVNLDAGKMHLAVTIATALAGACAILLRERGQPFGQVATDVLNELSSGLKPGVTPSEETK
jgi:hypothetical protein